MQLFDALFAVLVGIGVCVLYYAGTNVILDRIFSEKNGLLSGKYRLQNTIQPWIFLAPALCFLGFYLVYPVYETLRLSFFNFGGFEFVGLKLLGLFCRWDLKAVAGSEGGPNCFLSAMATASAPPPL